MTQYHIRHQLSMLGIGLVLYGVGLFMLPVSIVRLALKEKSPLAFLDFGKLSEENFTQVWLLIGGSRATDETVKKTCSQAYGVVLDLGPGSGQTVGYLDKSKITKVFGIEPNPGFHQKLQENIDKAGLTGIYTIVGCGVQDTETLRKYGIEDNSIDSIVACKVLCSIPDPKENIKALYSILAPGGQLLFLEHVKSLAKPSLLIQNFLNPSWRFLMAGCNLQRPTDAYLLDSGDWESKKVEYPEGDFGIGFITFRQGKLVKPKKT